MYSVWFYCLCHQRLVWIWLLIFVLIGDNHWRELSSELGLDLSTSHITLPLILVKKKSLDHILLDQCLVGSYFWRCFFFLRKKKLKLYVASYSCKTKDHAQHYSCKAKDILSSLCSSPWTWNSTVICSKTCKIWHTEHNKLVPIQKCICFH